MSATSPWQTSRQSARVLRRTPLAWNVTANELDLPDKSDETRFTDFIGFAALAFPALDLAGFPLSELAAALLTGLALTRPAYANHPVARLAAGPAVVIGYLALTSLAHHVVDERRLLHLALWAALAYVLATGRVHLPSAGRGLAVGLVVSIALSGAGLSPTGYVGRLSGFIGDPNGGGYTMTVLGFAALSLLRSNRMRAVVLAVVPVAVVLTYSRTTLLALLLALVWLVIGRRLGPLVSVAVLGAMAYLVTHVPDQLRLLGPFSDRTGSDELRDRLIAQEHADVSLSPWTGAGAGTAKVDLEGNTFFYHSSYLALQREGGLIALVLLVALVVVLALRLLGQPSAARDLWSECALICTMVCAINVGEVLLELPAAVALGVALHHLTNAGRGGHRSGRRLLGAAP